MEILNRPNKKEALPHENKSSAGLDPSKGNSTNTNTSTSTTASSALSTVKSVDKAAGAGLPQKKKRQGNNTSEGSQSDGKQNVTEEISMANDKSKKKKVKQK
jgi:hypothetical protein